MGFEDEAEQSITRPYRQIDDRSKRTCELTSSIVPRGTSFHGLVELEYSPIVIDPAWLSCRRDLPGPTELSAINPYAVHDHGQSARQGHTLNFHFQNFAGRGGIMTSVFGTSLRSRHRNILDTIGVTADSASCAVTATQTHLVRHRRHPVTPDRQGSMRCGAHTAT